MEVGGGGWGQTARVEDIMCHCVVNRTARSNKNCPRKAGGGKVRLFVLRKLCVTVLGLLKTIRDGKPRTTSDFHTVPELCKWSCSCTCSKHNCSCHVSLVF